MSTKHVLLVTAFLLQPLLAFAEDEMVPVSISRPDISFVEDKAAPGEVSSRLSVVVGSCGRLPLKLLQSNDRGPNGPEVFLEVVIKAGTRDCRDPAKAHTYLFPVSKKVERGTQYFIKNPLN